MLMTNAERDAALTQMKAASDKFYSDAIKIGNHPFVEFAGLMNEYILACTQAHQRGINFTACSAHTGQPLPMHPNQVKYVNEKLECIFAGRSVMRTDE